MKNLLFFTILFGCCHFLNAQLIDENYNELTLSREAPSHLPERLKRNDQVKFGRLITDVDSLIITFGIYPGDEQSRKCYVHLKNGGTKTWFVSSLEPIDGSDFYSLEGELEIVPYTKKVSFKVLNDVSTDKFYYTWLNGGETQKYMAVLDVDNPVKLNEPIPYFKVERMDQEELSTDEFLGHWIVLNWWATSCRPCIAEMPGLNKLVKMYEDNDSIKFIATARDDRDRWENFLSKKQFDYLQTLSNDATNSIFGESYPKNIIIDPKGVVRYYSEGGHDLQYLELNEALERQMAN